MTLTRLATLATLSLEGRGVKKQINAALAPLGRGRPRYEGG